jgi:DNA-binding CsgD family transcriptional regulator
MLLDRLPERAALGQLLKAARGGRSAVLVVRGEAGVGKTALLEDAIASAAGMRIARIAGVESEMELAYAALQQLCTPMLDRLERLPDPQRDALGVAFGLRAGEAPDRFLVGLAALSVLSEVAGERPMLCVIDDAQWLDRASAQALGIVGRRLLAEPVGMLVATREPDGEFMRLPELHIGGLADGDARELLASVITRPLDEQVRERIVAETRGNPLALLELPGGLTQAELAGGFGGLDASGLPGRLEDSFRQRIEALPPATRRLLLVAAAEPTGDPVLVWRAAGLLGIMMEAAAAAQADGLLAIGQRVTFRHPLVRSAAYRAASPEERRAAHQALADATDPQADPDRRAWHRAQATLGPDEEVAGELEHSADRAQARGGLAAAAAFLERSAALTLDPVRRAERALAAAHAKYLAGALDAALGLVAAAEAGPVDEFRRARAGLLRGRIAFASKPRGSDATPLLVKAARQFEPLDARLARDTYLEALVAARFAGNPASADDVLEVATAARAAPPAPQPASASDLLLDGMAVLITEGYPEAAPVLKRAVSACRRGEISTEEELRWLLPVSIPAGLVWDYESWVVLSDRQVEMAIKAGALTALPLALNMRTLPHLFAGELADAASLVTKAESATEAIGSSIAPYGALALAAFRGREAEAAELIAATNGAQRGKGVWLTFVQWATAVLYNGLGRYEEALAAAQPASEDVHALCFAARELPSVTRGKEHVSGDHSGPVAPPVLDLVANWAVAELIEAAARSRVPERAAGPLQRLSQITRASRTDWALGIQARAHALVSDGESAESLYRKAIEYLSRTRLWVELGRAHLVYGEWLRRQRRIRDARDQLRRSYELFTKFGMEAFAERARIELRATGVHARKQTAGTRDALTAQEALIARLAGQGASNAQIAAQLFISPATVAYHLGKVFAKIGISSRSQLARALPARPDATVAGSSPSST